MNTSSLSETKPSFSVKDTLSKAVPESIAGSVLFWGALPASLLFFAVGVSFLCASPFSFYLPFLVLSGGVLCLRWRTAGLCGSYLALALLLFTYYGEIPFEERLWQMGIIFALAVNFFIVLLSAEEIETLIGQTAEAGKTKTKELTQALLQLHQVSQEKEDLQKSLEEEIRRLKEQAEQRRIEMREESKRMELVQSEIELLTSQKTHFVEEAKKAREIIEQDRHTQKIIQDADVKILALEGRLLELSETLDKERSSKERLAEKISHTEELQEQVLALTEDLNRAQAFKEENAALRNQIEDLAEHLRQAEELKAQVPILSAQLDEFKLFKEENTALRNQIDVLSEKLNLAQSEKEAELAALSEELSRAQGDSEEKRALQARIAALTENLNDAEAIRSQNTALKAQVEDLAESLKRAEAGTKDTLLFAQERIMSLQVSPVIKVDEKKIKQLDGLYKQLRSQFEEKARVLSQTRKDLFHTEGKLMALEHEKALALVDPDQDEACYFEGEIDRMSQEIASLEEEVFALEELISQVSKA